MIELFGLLKLLLFSLPDSKSESFKYSLSFSKRMEVKIEIPNELEFIKQAPNIDWSILVGKLIKSKLDRIARLSRTVSKSKLTESDVEELTDKINSSLSQKYLE